MPSFAKLKDRTSRILGAGTSLDASTAYKLQGRELVPYNFELGVNNGNTFDLSKGMAEVFGKPIIFSDIDSCPEAHLAVLDKLANESSRLDREEFLDGLSADGSPMAFYEKGYKGGFIDLRGMDSVYRKTGGSVHPYFGEFVKIHEFGHLLLKDDLYSRCNRTCEGVQHGMLREEASCDMLAGLSIGIMTQDSNALSNIMAWRIANFSSSNLSHFSCVYLRAAEQIFMRRDDLWSMGGDENLTAADALRTAAEVTNKFMQSFGDMCEKPTKDIAMRRRKGTVSDIMPSIDESLDECFNNAMV